ncbi:CDP-alcohol phosphatidyltransferase [Adlercreutzia faecimuris]|uniref:CDP-alcohol phosphatidyltransferase n=1 Tax=Adlercreutzia faecimuris TaxID=2897341 RepID=A0ABS9WKE9_9ACTN|nr:CDP-alcohol phosphatidyltransferase [Adlercreutzia sp. JBNU-10]MCI2242911.1 CDP-alcohol phosphatidyltransferase [Adlercreutzia sp. JBNU-10]
MGVKSAEVLEISYDELPTYLHAHHSVYMDVDGATYYLTDVNDRYWRVQDTAEFNEKGHYVDCSDLVPTLSEFLELPFLHGKAVKDLFEEATFYASEKPE